MSGGKRTDSAFVRFAAATRRAFAAFAKLLPSSIGERGQREVGDPAKAASRELRKRRAWRRFRPRFGVRN